MNNTEYKSLDRETKILLIGVLRRGGFTDSDIEILSQKIIFNIPVEEWINVHFKEPVTAN
jgi:hypothetical protein